MGRPSKKTKNAPTEIEQLAVEIKKEQAKEKIKEYKSKIKSDNNPSFLKRVHNNAMIAEQYRIIGDIENYTKHYGRVIQIVNESRGKKKWGMDEKTINTVYRHYENAHFALAPHSFHHFLLCMEWDYKPEMKFYSNRISVMRDWAKELERLEKGELDILGISAPPRTGKAQPLYSKVLTPDGWTTMGEIEVGDEVIASDGKACKVTAVFPQGLKDTYRVWFSDDTYADCAGDHLWSVQTPKDRREGTNSVLKTTDMLDTIGFWGDKRKYSIHYVKPVEFHSHLTKDDIHPYVLGVLLGDGHLGRRIKFTSPDAEIVQKVSENIPESETLSRFGIEYYIIKKEKGYYPTDTAVKITRYGLANRKSDEKFIPEKYMLGSVEERLELLRGLMDTDGSASKVKTVSTCTYTTTSERLADQVIELVRSLGGRANKKSRDSYYTTPTKERIYCKKSYIVYISMEICPFYLSRKAEKFTPRDMRKYKYIRKIERIEDTVCKCIMVDHPEHLYVTDNYILTHNSGVETLFMLWVAGRHPDKSILFATHTNAMAVKIQQDFYNMAIDPKRQYSRIFPGIEISQSAEYLYVDFSPKPAENNYKTIYFRGIDGGFAGVLEASWLIVVDDLIKNIEEALNPTRLATANQKYAVDIMQRRTDDSVKELHIATRWSVRDVLSTLETDNENNDRAKFIKVPGLNEAGESNFNFPYRPMTKEHFLKLKRSMDEVSFECIIQQNPIERDGIVFPKDSLLYYEGVLPSSEPDEVVFWADLAFGGGDYLSMPIAYVYGKDAYIHDVVHTKAHKFETKPLIVQKIMQHQCGRGGGEANNGGDEYMADVDAMLRQEGYRCHLTTQRAPTIKNKLSRILDCQAEIKGLSVDDSGYRLYFLSERARHNNPMYQLYMQHLMNFNQSSKFVGKQKDDAADATAGLITNILNRKNRSGTVQVLSRKMLAI